MSALGDYYLAQTREKNASLALIAPQAEQARQQGNLLAAQVNDLPANDAARNRAENAQAGLSTANAGLVGQQASQVAADSAAKRAALGADAGLGLAQAGAISARLPGEIAAQQAGVGLTQANTLDVNARTTGTGINNNFLPSQIQSGLTGSLLDQNKSRAMLGLPYAGSNLIGFEKGGVVGRDTMMPGKGDSVPAMLAPGEAVLNSHAVAHYGEHVIDHMNRMGLLRQAAHKEHMDMLQKITAKSKGKAKKGR